VLRLDGFGRLFLKPHGAAEVEHRYDWDRRGFAGDSVLATNRHILDAWRAGRPAVNEGREYLRNVALVEAVYRSHDAGRRLDLR